MLKHYFLTTLRHIWKRRLYSFISFLSLTLGLTVFSLLLLFVRREFSYNSAWPDADRIYRVMRYQDRNIAGLPDDSIFQSFNILGMENYLEDHVETMTRVRHPTVKLNDEEKNLRFSLALVDDNFQSVFPVDVIAGDLQQVLRNPGFIALERSQAEELLAQDEPYLGQGLELTDGLNIIGGTDIEKGSPVRFEVAAIYDLPQPLTSSQSIRALTRLSPFAERLIPRMDGNFIGGGEMIWLKLRADSSIAQVEQSLARYVEEASPYMSDIPDRNDKPLSEFYHYWLQKGTDLHFDVDNGDNPSGDMRKILTFSAVALLVLMAGCSNAISLALASALERQREAGIRKAVGGTPGSIAGQFLGESMLIAGLTLMPVLLLCHLLSAPFARLLSLQGIAGISTTEVSLLAGVALLVGLVNGSYPALVLARVKPVEVLKPAASGRKVKLFNLRSLLVGLQFTFSIMLLVGTGSLYAQLQLTLRQPLGFDKNNLVLIGTDLTYMTAAGEQASTISRVLADRLLTEPGIQGATTSAFFPGVRQRMHPEYTMVTSRQEEEGMTASQEPITWRHFEFFGIPLLAGREFERGRDNNPTFSSVEEAIATPVDVLINRAAARALGYSNPAEAIDLDFFYVYASGPIKRHYPLHVIGVVEDAMLNDLGSLPGPEIYRLTESGSTTVTMRYDEAIADRVQEVVDSVWQEVTQYPGRLTYLEDRLTSFYASQQRENRLLLICAGLALFLSCIGLYGLVSVALKTQVKEIGVRKVLGASTVGVIGTFLKRFSIPVLLANLVAWPVAVYFVLQWIQQFPYQLDKAWLLPICLGTSAVVILIAWVTVTALTWRAASLRPVKSLRYE